jgi:hypothetical protein
MAPKSGLVRAVAATLLAVMGALLVACGDCNSYGTKPQYAIRVRDAASGSPLCDAMVWVNGQEWPVQMANCAHVGEIPLGAPTATIRAEHAGYVTSEKQVSTKYPTDSCGHAELVSVELVLQKL